MGSMVVNVSLQQVHVCVHTCTGNSPQSLQPFPPETLPLLPETPVVQVST